MVRSDKNQPQEVSSKVPVSVLRQVVAPVRHKAHDPRFDTALGHYNADLFAKSYAFVGDLQRQELAELQTRLKATRDVREADRMQRVVDRLKSMEATKRRTENQKLLLKERRQVEQELVAKGKRPFYLKKTDVRRMELADKYKKLKEKSGDKAIDVDKLVEKRRKHKAADQHRFLPN